jgi:diguanylate cyclase (GGDEF)-like protein
MRKIHIRQRLVAALCAACWAVAIALPSQGAVVSSALPSNARYAVEHFGDRFGLNAITVTSLAQDRFGFLWIGTQTGLLRYDGSRIRRFEQVEKTTSHYIDRLLIAPDGALWVKGGNGIGRLKQERFAPLPLPEKAGLLAESPQGFAVDSANNVFVAVEHGLVRVEAGDASKARLFTAEDGLRGTVGAISRATDDSIWFVAGDRIGRFAPRSATWEWQSISNLPADRVLALQWDGHGILWLRTAKHVARLDSAKRTFVLDDRGIPPANGDGLPSLDHDGDLLLPSLGGLFHRINGEWHVITDRQGLSSNSVVTALEDREGILWVSGMGTGLDRVIGMKEWSAWTRNEGLPGWLVWDELRDRQGRLWVATSSGLAMWDGRSDHWQVFTEKNGLGGPEVQELAVAGDGAIWAFSRTAGLTRIDPQTLSMKRLKTVSPLPGKAGSDQDLRFLFLAAAPDGQVWASGHEFLLRFDPRSSPLKPNFVPLPDIVRGSGWVFSFSPKGVLWLGGSWGLERFDGQTWRNFTTQDGLLAAPAIVIATGEDDVWVSYNDVPGVTHLTVDSSGIPTAQQFPLDVSIMGKDSHGRIWCGGIDGLVILQEDGTIRTLNHSDGLIWDDTSPLGFWEERDGSFLIGTSRGLAHYIPRFESAEPTAPGVALTSVVLGDEDRRNYPHPVVEHEDGTLAVEMTPLTLRNPDKVECRYRLAGLEPRFTQTMQREVRYPALPAGEYQLFVECGGERSGWSLHPATFSFQVKPPWWQTWWARLLGLISLFAGVWGLVELRTRSIDKRRQQLETAVAERSAELVRKNAELQEISLTDPLTHARNRRYFAETIGTDASQAGRAYQRAREHGLPCADHRDLVFIMVDLDWFKAVNDKFGHAAGDRLLQEVAVRLASAIRTSDELVRWGGEEFLIICRSTDRAQIPAFCARILEIVADEPFGLGEGADVWMTCSIGWTPYPWLRESVEALSVDDAIKLADKAMYCAKDAGRNKSIGLLPSPQAVDSPETITLENLADVAHSPLIQLVKTEAGVATDNWSL